MPYWHITLASRGRVTLFPSEAELRVAVGKLLAVNGKQGLLYSIVDDHLHDVVEAETERAANELCRRIRLNLRGIAAVPFFGRDVAPVESRSHLKALVRYLLTQPVHHRLPCHPALWTGSCFLDLAGARWLPETRRRLKEALPRLSWHDLLEMVGLPSDPLSPLGDDRLFTLGITRVAEATAAAINVAPALGGSDRRTLLARRCLVSLARQAGFRRRDLERALAWPARSITRYGTETPPESALVAVRRRLALEQLVATSRSVPSP